MADTLSLSPEQFKSAMMGGGSLSPNSPNFSWQVPPSVQAQRNIEGDRIASDPRDATPGNLPIDKRDAWNASEISSELANPNLTRENQSILLNERSKLGKQDTVEPSTLSLSPEQFRNAFSGGGIALTSSSISLSPEDFKKAFSGGIPQPSTNNGYVQGRDANPLEAGATALVDMKGQSFLKNYHQSMVAPFEVVASLTASIPEFVLGAAGGFGAAAGALASGKLPTQKDIDEGMAGGAPQWAKDFAHFGRPRTAGGRLLNAPVEAVLDLAIQGAGRVASLPAAQWATIKEAMDKKWSLNRLVQTFKKTSDDITPLTTALVGLGLAGKMGRDTQIFLEKKLEQKSQKRLEELEKQAKENDKKAVWENAQRDLEKQILPFEEPKPQVLPDVVDFQKPLFPESLPMAGEIPRRMQEMERTPTEFTDRPAEVGQMTSRAGEPNEMMGKETPRQFTEQMTIDDAIRQSIEQERIASTQQHAVETMNDRAPSPQEGALGPFDSSPRPRETPTMDPSERPISQFGEVGEARAQALERTAAERVQEGLNRDGIPVAGSQIPLGLRAFGGRQSGFIGFRRDAARQGVARALADQARENMYDTRPLAEIALEAVKKGVQNVVPYYNWLDTGQIGRVSRNPIFGAIAHRVFKIDRWIDTSFKDFIDGTHYERGITGRERRIHSADGMLTTIREMSRAGAKIKAELFEMKDKWLSAVGKAELTRADFKTDAQWNAFSSAQKGFKKLLETINKERVLNGDKPIASVSNFYPFVRSGDFMVRAIDKNGKEIKATATNGPFHARRIRSAWEKEVGKDGKARVWIEQVDPRGFKDQGHFLSFVLELNAELAKQGSHDLASRLSQVAANVMGQKRAGGHFLKKNTDIGGYLGSESGIKGIRNLEKAIEGYAYQALNYVGNLKKNKIQEEVSALPKEVKDAQKQTLLAAEEFISKSKGKDTNKAKFVDDAIMNVSMQMGLGATLPARALRTMNGAVFPYLLLTVRSVIQNVVQPVAALARISRMKATGDISGGTVVAHQLNGLKEWLAPSKESIEAYNWAQREGHMDATVGKLMDYKWGDLPTTDARAIKEIAKWPLTAIDKVIVRSLLFTTFEVAMRNTIKDKKTRWEKAAFEMNDAAVDYHPSHTPMIYDKAGLAGEATKGLKSFFHNQMGQIIDYVKLGAEQKTLGPITWALATMVTVGGLKGVIGVKEVDAFINLLNALTKGSTKTLTQWLTHNPNLPDALVQGGVSTALGYDISSSLSAPNAPSFFSAPGIEVTAGAVGAAGEYLIKRFKGEATEQDEFKTLLAISPSAARGAIETYYMGPDNFVRDPNRKMIPIYERSQEEQIISGITSLKSIRNSGTGVNPLNLLTEIPKSFTIGPDKFKHMGEAQAREFIRDTRELLKLDNAAKKEVLDAIIDRIKENKDISPQLLEKYIETGGSRQSLNTSIIKRMKEQEMTYVEQQLKGKMNSNKLDRLDPLLDIPLRRPPKSEPQSSIESDRSILPVKTQKEIDAEPRPTMKWDDVRGLAPRDRMPMIIPGDKRNQMPYIPREKYRNRRTLTI